MSLSALLVALAVSLAPTVLFLGLWRGLTRLRENALQRHGDASDLGQPAGSRASSSTPSTDSSPATCPDCGTDNDGYATFCVACLRKL